MASTNIRNDMGRYDQRTELVKDMLAKESAERDARTAKLKAQRLAKEAKGEASPDKKSAD
jgi:Arc/MetJ-type ribon-helix-helix transcriptional regulator